jgi:hypothetical protein
MCMYYLYQAKKTGKPYYSYLCTLSLALAILSHFEAFFLGLMLLIVLIAVRSYRKLFRSPHTYFMLIMLLVFKKNLSARYTSQICSVF